MSALRYFGIYFKTGNTNLRITYVVCSSLGVDLNWRQLSVCLSVIKLVVHRTMNSYIAR